MNPSVQSPACLPRELATSQVFLLGRLGHELKRKAIAALEEWGYGIYEYSVLALLAESACKAQTDIADVLQLDRSQVVGLLDALEEKQLVERRRDPDDRRRHKVVLTRAGRQELGRLRTLVKRIEDDFLAPLDDESRKTLYELLARIAQHHDSRFAVSDGAAAA